MANKLTHPPGPFFVTRKFEVGPRSDAEDQTHGMVVPVADVFGDNKESDAALFATSPDLLAAVKDARSMLEHVEVIDGEDGDPWSKALARMDAAIAKATGRAALNQTDGGA